jgi:hypothetical protein
MFQDYLQELYDHGRNLRWRAPHWEDPKDQDSPLIAANVTPRKGRSKRKQFGSPYRSETPETNRSDF